MIIFDFHLFGKLPIRVGLHGRNMLRFSQKCAHFLTVTLRSVQSDPSLNLRTVHLKKNYNLHFNTRTLKKNFNNGKKI